MTDIDNIAIKRLCNGLVSHAEKVRAERPVMASALQTLVVQLRNFVAAKGEPKRNLRRSIRRTLHTLATFHADPQ